MKKRKRGGFSGSLTIEAAFLLPLILFLIWNILLLSFFLYDQCIAIQGSYCTALRTERFTGTEAERERLAEEKYRQAVQERIAYSAVSGKTEIGKKEVTVQTKLSVQTPSGSFYKSSWKGEQIQRAERWQPVHFIRSCRKAEDLWELLQMEKK